MAERSAPASLPARLKHAHKGNFGRIILVGGSRGMAGSIAMSSIAALRCGSGLVSAAVPDRCLETVAAFHPCVMTMPMPCTSVGTFSLEAAGALSGKIGKVDAIGCGPGMTAEPGSLRIVDRLLQATSIPRVLDADAINALAVMNFAHAATDGVGPIVLTPHPGEFENLTRVSAKDRASQIDAAGELARQTGAVIVLKGGPTVVIDADQTWTNTTGNPGMATAGSGDVLTGVITSLVGQGLSVWDAARLGVWIHGKAGDHAAGLQGMAGMTAADILDALPQAVALAVKGEW